MRRFGNWRGLGPIATNYCVDIISSLSIGDWDNFLVVSIRIIEIIYFGVLVRRILTIDIYHLS